MEMNNTKTHNQNPNKNKNKNNNLKKNEAEGETDMAVRQPSPARSDGSIRSTRSSLLGLKAKTEKGSRSTSYEVREPKIVLKDIRKIDLDFNWIKRSANVESSLGTDVEAITLSPGASVGSGVSAIPQRVADTNTQTLQPPRSTSARTTGLVRCSEGEKDNEEDTEAMDTDLEVMDMEIEQDLPDKKEKRGRGRPPTTFEHVGKREKDEERARQKKEEELEKRAKEALSSNPPQGKKWEKAQDEVKKIEEELSKAPTIDIAAQAVEQSVRVYKVADCSNKMKESLVAQLRQAAMTNLAAVNVMAARARETSNEELAGIRCELEKLRMENQRLRREVEQLRECSQAATPSSLVSNPSGKVSLGAKRRKTYISSDTDSESEKRTESPPPQQQAREETLHQPALPPLKQYATVLKEGRSIGHKEMEIDPLLRPT